MFLQLNGTPGITNTGKCWAFFCKIKKKRLSGTPKSIFFSKIDVLFPDFNKLQIL